MSTVEAAAGKAQAMVRDSVKTVIAASMVGTAIEFYDFYAYGTAAANYFPKVFFGDTTNPTVALLASLLTFAIAFIARPLGSLVFGHFGDRMGRKTTLVVSLLTMGIATFLIGCLPTYNQWGVAAVAVLCLCRFVQGIGLGGEWSGAALVATENAPEDKRALYGSFPELGAPIGFFLSNGTYFLLETFNDDDAMLAWGWRVPFLLSVVLILVGYYVRRRVEESPVFAELAERKEETRMPIVQLFRKHALLVIIAALVFAGNNAVGYMTTGGYIQGYATNPDGPIALERGPVLWAVAGSAVTWLITTLVAGVVSDRLGRRKTYIIGWILQLVGVFTLFPLVNTGSIWLLFLGLAILTIGLGFTYGPQAAMYAELYPASIRFSGVSISYALGAILGGAFAPLIAAALVKATGGTGSVTVYLAVMTLIGLGATLMLRDRTGIPLGPDHEAEQSVSPIYGVSKA